MEKIKSILIPKPRKRTRKQNTDDAEAASTPKQKGKAKATTASAYRGRNVGKLARLLEMPVDIFCEISQHLKPIDLIQLSRSSKSFNHMLTSRSSKSIWRAARGAFPDLPDCPSDLSEPGYAKLVFLKECHECSVNRVMKADFELRTRLCRHCRTTRVVNGNVLLVQVPNLTEELLECLPSEHSWYMRGSCRMRTFLKTSAERIVKDYHKAVPSTLPPAELEKAKSDFIASKQALLKESETHAKELERWVMKQAQAKHHTDNEAIKRRRDAIRAKLLELGYAEEDIPPTHYNHFSHEWNNMLQQPRDLTPRIWNNIRPKLESIIQDYKVYREEKQRMSRHTDRIKELKGHLVVLLADMRADDPNFLFNAESAYDLPTCVSLVQANSSWNPITMEIWSEAKDQVQSEILAKIDAQEEFLISSITSLDVKQQAPKRLSIPENVDKQFLLASSTYFACKRCKFPRNYPELRNHPCSAPNPEFAFDPDMTAMAQALAVYIPEDEDECSLKTKMLVCNICHGNFSWVGLLSHFRFKDSKSRVDTRHHILEGELEKKQNLFSVVHYDDDDDDGFSMMPPYMDFSDYDDPYFGGYDYYYDEDDDYGFHDIDGPMNGCIIS